MEKIGIEIPVLELDKGINFYEKVFEWKFDRETFPNQGYVKIDESIGVSIFQSTKMRPKGLNVGFNVLDLDKTIESIKREHGKIIKEKFKMGDFGHVAVFQDCFGNELSLFSES